jgi:hypothetical protein
MLFGGPEGAKNAWKAVWNPKNFFGRRPKILFGKK